jgi:hypothetical protein
MRFAMPVGMAVVIALCGTMTYQTWSLRREVEERFTRVDGAVNSLSTKVGAAAKAAAQPARGPDPNKVHTVKTEGAPAKGAPGAPIVIAEFSDFQ